MTPKDRNIVAARLAGFRVAIVQPGERDIDATHTPLDGEYPCVVDDRGILLFYPDAESTLAPTCYWRPDADAMADQWGNFENSQKSAARGLDG